MGYSIKVTERTTMKLSVLQSSLLDEGEKQAIAAGAHLPIGSWAVEAGHVRVSFAKDSNGKQITFPSGHGPRNTWYFWAGHVDILKDGEPLDFEAIAQSVNVGKSGTSWLRMTPTGQRDRAGCLLYHLDWMLGGRARPDERVLVVSGAAGADPIWPTNDYRGSYAPCYEGVFDLGPVERGWWGNAIGAVWVSVDPKAHWAVNNRSAIGIHEDANRAWSPGSAGCICPLNANDTERVAGWLNSQNPPQFLVVDHGLGWLQNQGWKAPNN